MVQAIHISVTAVAEQKIKSWLKSVLAGEPIGTVSNTSIHEISTFSA